MCVYLVRAASRDEDALAIMLLKGPGLHPLLPLQRLQVCRPQHEFLHRHTFSLPSSLWPVPPPAIPTQLITIISWLTLEPRSDAL